MKLARSSEGVSDVDHFVIRQNDQYGRRYGEARTVDLIPAPFGQDRGPVIGFCAVAFLTGGGVVFDEMTTAEVVEHAKRFTKANSFGPFAGIDKAGAEHENFEPYGLKTVMIRLCTRKLSLSRQAASAVEVELEDDRAAVAQGVAQVMGTLEAPEPVVEAVPADDDPVALMATPLSHGDGKGVPVNELNREELEGYVKQFGGKLPIQERKAISMAMELFGGTGE